MKSLHRRVLAAAATLALGAGVVVAVPAAASADPAYPAPNVYESGTFDAGTSGSYEVVWTAPAGTPPAGATLTGYQATLNTGATYSDPVSTSDTDGTNNVTFEFDGLTYGQSYEAEVRAVYSVAQTAPAPPLTEFSDYSFGDPAEVLHAPPAVVSPSAKATGDGRVTVRWKQPTALPYTEPTTFYGLTATPDGTVNDTQIAQISTVADATATSATFHSLQPGMPYDIEIDTISISDSGSLDLGSTDVTVTALGAPNRPGGLSVHAVPGGRADLTWKKSASTSGRYVSGYKVYVDGHLVRTVSAHTFSYTATGEKKGSTYTFAVKAYNTVGESSAVSVKARRTIR